MQRNPESLTSRTMRSVRIDLAASAVFLLFVSAFSAGYAQQGEDSQNTLLPEIDPQDIEIRSEFNARFPGLRRQPILGFNPSPRVYRIDPERTPFMETREEIVANLPISDLARPAAPEYEALDYSRPINAFGRFGAGSFLSPEAELWGIYELSENSYLGTSVDYQSSDGHLDNRSSSYRYLDANAEFATKLGDRTRLKLKGGHRNDFNYMATAPALTYDGSKKAYGGFDFSAELRNFKNSIEGWEASAGYRDFKADLEAGTVPPATEDESVVNASFSKRWAGSHTQETITLKLGGRGGQYSPSGQWYTVQGGVRYQRLFDYSTRLTAEGGVVYASNALGNTLYIAPSAELKHWLQDDLTVKLQVEGRPYHTTLREHHQANRFFNLTGPLRHTYQADGRAEIEFSFLEGSSLKGGMSYMTAKNYPYYQMVARADGAGNGYGYFTVNYMDADRIKGYIGVAHQLIPEKFWFDAKAYIQKPKLDNGNDIPYQESWGINSSLSISPFDRLTLELWGDYVGERKTVSSATLNGFLLLGSRVDVRISDTFGVYAKLVNLLSQEYQVWTGYRERPFQAYGGVTVKID